MDKRKGLINIAVSVLFKLILTVLTLISRRMLIKYLGNDINGLNSLYLSIINVISIAELGIGSSIIYCMYKPVVNGETKKVAALYNLYDKLYKIIAKIIIVCGVLILPFLGILAKDYNNVNTNLYCTFLLMLISDVATYFFSAKTSLINAYKNDYITTTISSIGLIFQCVLQIVVLIITKSFVYYLICRIIAVVVQWILTNCYVDKKYKNLINTNYTCDDETKKDIRKKVTAMFIHKLGGIFVNSADSIIISSFLGVIILGKYSNYVLIITSMISVLSLIFTSLMSVIGHMMVDDDKSTSIRYFNILYDINFVLGIIFFCGYNQIIDEVVYICFGSNLKLDRLIVYVITINYYIQFMRKSVITFRDACGAFYFDRYKPIFEGVTNIILSILFVYILPEDYKVVGVIVATIITNLLICNIIEPYVLFKYGFKANCKGFLIKNYFLDIVFIIILVIISMLKIQIPNNIISLIINGGISVAITLFCCIIFILSNKVRREETKRMLNWLYSQFYKLENKKKIQNS